MNREKKLIVALAAMVEVLRKHEGHYFTFDEDERVAYAKAIELLSEAAQDCDDCVDY
jgi:hypothetical protein